MSSTSLSRSRLRRRMVLAAFYGVVAMGIGVALAAAPGRGAGAPAAAGANKAAAESQFEKAKALYDAGNFADAQTENDKALALDPNNENAILLKRVVAAKLAAGNQPGGAAPAAAGGRVQVLTAPQMSMIRLIELGPDDKVTGHIDPKVLEDFWQNVVKKDPMVDATQATHDKFMNPSNFPIQARHIRDDNEDKYMQAVTVTSDPSTILAFKQNVNTYVLSNCATAACHGGGNAGNFHLLSAATSSEQVYTNYYILTMYANADGKMIDRANPNSSLLTQYGLPWASAAIKHPKADVHKLTGLNDTRLTKMIDWIQNLGLTRPNYHISYEVPGMTAASAPADTTAPATAASMPAGK